MKTKNKAKDNLQTESLQMMQPSYLQSIQTAPMALYHKMNNPIKKWAEDCLTSLYLTSLNMIISRFFYIATNVIISFFLLLSNSSWYLYAAAAAAKSLQSCLTLCDSMGCNPPGSSDHRILLWSPARILEWVAMPSSRGSSPIQVSNLCLMSSALTDRFFTTSATWKAPVYVYYIFFIHLYRRPTGTYKDAPYR